MTKYINKNHRNTTTKTYQRFYWICRDPTLFLLGEEEEDNYRKFLAFRSSGDEIVGDVLVGFPNKKRQVGNSELVKMEVDSIVFGRLCGTD